MVKDKEVSGVSEWYKNEVRGFRELLNPISTDKTYDPGSGVLRARE